MITVISGTNRKGSECLNFAKLYADLLQKHTEEKVKLLSLEQIPHDWFHEAMYSEQSPSVAALQDEYVLPADKMVFVMPEYNGSYPGSVKLFIDAWRDDDRRRKSGHWSCIHRYKSLYVNHLHCWFDTFPRRQIKVILFEDMKDDSMKVMQDLYSYLNVDPNFKPDTSIIHNQTGEIVNPLLRNAWLHSSALRRHLPPLLPLSYRGKLFRRLAGNTATARSSAEIPAELRAELTEELHASIRELEELIDRDLSSWC